MQSSTTPDPGYQVNVFLNNYKQNTTSLSLLAGKTVGITGNKIAIEFACR